MAVELELVAVELVVVTLLLDWMRMRPQCKADVLVGAEMMLGPGILVCVQKAFHFLATKYEHVFIVSVIGILHLNKKNL